MGLLRALPMNSMHFIDQAEVPERIAGSLEICQKFWAGSPFAFEGKFLILKSYSLGLLL